MKRASDQFSNIKARETPSTNNKQLGQDVTAFLQKLRIHPQAQRILGDSCIPVVRLERLNFQSVLLSSSLQPVVSLVRLQKQTRGLHGDSVCLDHLPQNAFRQDEAKIFEIREDQSKFEESSDLSQPDSSPKSWSEPCCPESPASDNPEQDSGFHCESDPYQPYILFDSTSDEWRNDSGTFYLDPDPEQTIVIELDPELEAEEDQFSTLEDECEVICEMDVVEVEDQASELCCSQDEEDSPLQQPEPGPESEDFCAVCLNGGDLLCCDSCPKVYHLACHVPALNTFPVDDWMCTLCRTDLEPVGSYSCENLHPHGGIKAPYTLSNQDQRRCEKLTLRLYCHTLSAPFHEPVSPLARNYYQIIKRPINLSGIRRKLDKSNTLHYFTAGQFVDDVLLMFKNCATFNYPDSEVAQAGQNLEMFFLSNLTEVFPDQTFTSASQDATDRVRLRWLGRKSKENHKKKRCMLGGKKCYYFY